jgi:small GTP-binding protein
MMAVIQKKICMLGSFGVGKTSLVARFVQGIFSGKYLSTVGVKIDKKQLRVGDQDVLLLLWDLAGEDSRSQVQTSYLKGAAGYFLVVDGTFAQSLVTAKSIHERAVEAVGEIPVMLIVNKSDLWDRWEISMPELEKLQAEGWSVQVTSAKTGEGVEKMFTTLAEHILKNSGPSSEKDATER